SDKTCPQKRDEPPRKADTRKPNRGREDNSCPLRRRFSFVLLPWCSLPRHCSSARGHRQGPRVRLSKWRRGRDSPSPGFLLPAAGTIRTRRNRSSTEELMIRFTLDDDRIQIPNWVVDLDSFRRWAEDDGFPEKGQLSFLRGDVWVDLSK